MPILLIAAAATIAIARYYKKNGDMTWLSALPVAMLVVFMATVYLSAGSRYIRFHKEPVIAI